MRMTTIVTIIHMELKGLVEIGRKTILRDFEEGKIHGNNINLKIKERLHCSHQKVVAGGEC